MRHPLRVLSVAGLLAIVAACGGGPGNLTAKGTVEVFANPLNGMNVQDSYPDITPGGTVTIVDSSGKVIDPDHLSRSLIIVTGPGYRRSPGALDCGRAATDNRADP